MIVLKFRITSSFLLVLLPFSPQDLSFSPPHNGESAAVKSLSHQLDLLLHEVVVLVDPVVVVAVRIGDDEEKFNDVAFSSSKSLNDLHRKMSLTLTETSEKFSFLVLVLLESLREMLLGKASGDLTEANGKNLTALMTLLSA